MSVSINKEQIATVAAWAELAPILLKNLNAGLGCRQNTSHEERAIHYAVHRMLDVMPPFKQCRVADKMFELLKDALAHLLESRDLKPETAELQNKIGELLTSVERYPESQQELAIMPLSHDD